MSNYFTMNNSTRTKTHQHNNLHSKAQICVQNGGRQCDVTPWRTKKKMVYWLYHPINYQYCVILYKVYTINQFLILTIWLRFSPDLESFGGGFKSSSRPDYGRQGWGVSLSVAHTNIHTHARTHTRTHAHTHTHKHHDPQWIDKELSRQPATSVLHTL